MGDILSQLSHLLVQSLPTVVLVFLLMVVLDRLFFKPLTGVLKQREEATTGALARAREQAAASEAKAREYEAALQAARQEVYRLQEADRRAALSDRGERLQKARRGSETLVKSALADLAAPARAAPQELARSAQLLAQDITQSVLSDGGPPARGRDTDHFS